MPAFIENIDVAILRAVEALDFTPLIWFSRLITHLGDGGIFWIVLSLLLAVLPKTRRVGIAMCVSLALSFLVVNVAIKPLVARIRPYDLYDFVARAEMPHDFSFPSGHSSISFAPAVAFAFAQRGRYRWQSAVLLVLAGLIALSRVILLVHYPSDVLAGSLIGAACGFAAAVITRYALDRLDEMQKSKEAKR